ncbi:MAG: hypothetical protein EOM19_05280 [Candidatus Moranbacteria bacterium]|nr:hypothetical protein [Candidatus Moranbacteria bacterium]
MSETLNNFKEKVQLLSEDYSIIESDDNGIKKVIIEGLAITFNKPTRNRVAYTYESGTRTHNTLRGKPFLDSHIDKSINTHPPFGHVIETWIDKNPKNNLPALYYKVDIDPEKKDFIRQMKRGDISGVSVQVLVDSVMDKQDMYGDYIQANIREFLELSAVLIPGDGDTTMRLVESFNSYKEDLNTSNGNAVINVGGVLPTRKVIRKDPESEEPKKEEVEKIYEPNPIIDDENDSSNKRLISKKMEKEKQFEERLSKMESLLETMSKSMESLAEGQPEDDKKGKVSGNEKDPENVNQGGVGMKSIESMIRQVLKEELKGSPERDTGYEKDKIGPENTSSLPQTVQPSNGKSPGNEDIFDNENRHGDEQEKDATTKVSKPKSDYNKPVIQKNSMEEARAYIEKAKTIMKEYAKGEDVFEGQAGRVEKEPHEMEDAKPKKGDSGFKEMSDKKDDEDENENEKKSPMEKMYESLRNEIKQESVGRKSIIGTPVVNTSSNTIQSSIKEYLSKTGVNNIIYNK